LAAARRKLNCSPADKLNVYFQDEGRFGRMANPVSCWAPKPVRPKLPLQRVREYTYVYSALCPEDGDLFSLILPYSDTGVMQVFLDEFAKHLDGRKAVIIMDQAPWHREGNLILSENVLLAFLPPYSPELNPVEHLWEHLREKYTSNTYWESMRDLEDHLCKALRESAEDRETMKSLSLFDWMVYV